MQSLPVILVVVAAAVTVLVVGWIVTLRGHGSGGVDFTGVRLQVVAFALFTFAVVLAIVLVGYPVAGWPALVAAGLLVGWTVLLVLVATRMRPGP